MTTAVRHPLIACAEWRKKLQKMIAPRGNTTIPPTLIPAHTHALANNESRSTITRGTHSFPSDLKIKIIFYFNSSESVLTEIIIVP